VAGLCVAPEVLTPALAQLASVFPVLPQCPVDLRRREPNEVQAQDPLPKLLSEDVLEKTFCLAAAQIPPSSPHETFLLIKTFD